MANLLTTLKGMLTLVIFLVTISAVALLLGIWEWVTRLLYGLLNWLERKLDSLIASKTMDRD
jgi:hypothetical protein